MATGDIKRKRTEHNDGFAIPKASRTEEQQKMAEDTALAMIKFRNYAPRNQNLKVFMKAKPTVENKLDLEELAKPLSESNAIMDIAPKKPNWDLKRDVQRKLQRLDKRTQRAVISLLQQRVLADATGNGKQTGEELADAVDTRVREEQMALDDDE